MKAESQVVGSPGGADQAARSEWGAMPVGGGHRHSQKASGVQIHGASKSHCGPLAGW